MIDASKRYSFQNQCCAYLYNKLTELYIGFGLDTQICDASPDVDFDDYYNSPLAKYCVD